MKVLTSLYAHRRPTWRFVSSSSQVYRQLKTKAFSFHSRSQRATHHATKLPALRGIGADGSVIEVSEEELYSYTRHRWVYDEAHQLSTRYLKFNLSGLLEVAVAALHDRGAHHCVEILKCREGLNNKAYLLKMDNDLEVLAKLPNPCAGPSFYTTASEVATRSFLRDGLNIPTPRIIAWSPDSSNPVGAEYILEEKADGTQLGLLWKDWDQWAMESRYKIIEEIVEMEGKLASTKISQIGCVYFKDDIQDGIAMVTEPMLPSPLLERFTLGPLVDNSMWQNGRSDMKLNCGPFADYDDFVKAMEVNERLFLQKHCRPRMNYARSTLVSESPDEIVMLFDKYRSLTPALRAPSAESDIQSPTLWHSDLHLNNVFVDPIEKKISCVIDWQSTAALPLFYQCGIPTMFRRKRSISKAEAALSDQDDDCDKVTADQQQYVENVSKSKQLQSFYLDITKAANSDHWTALQARTMVQLEPVYLVQNVWEERKTYFLRRSLIRIVSQWEILCPGAGPCPVSFDEQEMTLFLNEEENMSAISEVLTLFRDKWGVPPDGLIEHIRYEEIKEKLEEMRIAFIEAADNDEDRLLAEKLWPYQDTPAST